jgi:hypothetical protein
MDEIERKLVPSIVLHKDNLSEEIEKLRGTWRDKEGWERDVFKLLNNSLSIKIDDILGILGDKKNVGKYVEFLCNINLMDKFFEYYPLTLLSLAVMVDNLEAVTLLLSGYKANPSGKTSEGLTFVSPISLALGLNRYEIIEILIQYGANINDTGTNMITLLNNAIRGFNPNFVEFILSKGSNPNLPRYSLPLNNLIEFLVSDTITSLKSLERLTDISLILLDEEEKDVKTTETFKNYYLTVANMLLFFGSNILLKGGVSIHDSTKENDIGPGTTPLETLEVLKMATEDQYNEKEKEDTPTDNLNNLKTILETLKDLSDLFQKYAYKKIENCDEEKDGELIRKIANAYKIPYKNISIHIARILVSDSSGILSYAMARNEARKLKIKEKEGLEYELVKNNRENAQKFAEERIKEYDEETKRICGCIKFIQENEDQIDFDLMKETRKEKWFKNCENTVLLNFTDEISEFTENEIVSYTDPDSGKVYCFHVSELPGILKDGKNPHISVADSKFVAWSPDIPKDVLERFSKILNFYPTVTFDDKEDFLGFKNDFCGAYNFKIDTYTPLDKLLVIEEMLKTANKYINLIGNIEEIPTSILYEFFWYIDPYLTVMDFVEIRYVVNVTSDREKVLNLIYHYFRYALTNNKISLTLLANVVSQIFEDFTIIKMIAGELRDIFEVILPDLRDPMVSLENLSEIIGAPNTQKVVEILENQGKNNMESWQNLREMMNRYPNVENWL